MEYTATMVNKSTGEIIQEFSGEMSNLTYVSQSVKKIPRSFTIKNTESNDGFYKKVKNLVGGTYQVESDLINGLFSISADGEDLLLTEVL